MIAKFAATPITVGFMVDISSWVYGSQLIARPTWAFCCVGRVTVRTNNL